MRNYSILLILLITILNYSCTDENCISGNNDFIEKEYNVVEFENVEFSHSGEVILRHGSSKVIVTAESNIMDKLDVRSENNTMKIGTKNSFCLNSNGITLEIFSENYNRLKNNGSADWTSDSLSIDPEIISNGSGDITLNGNSNQQTIEINGSGEVNLTSMPTNDAIVKINGSGDAELTVSGDAKITINGSGEVTIKGIMGVLDVKINGSGNVYYTGDPSEVYITDNGSGEVLKKGE